jgi:hypothetical protein
MTVVTFQEELNYEGRMNTGQMLTTILALILLTTVLTNFYSIVGNTGDDLARSQENILATAVATSWAEQAQGLAYDNVTDTSDIAFQNPSALTSPSFLGLDPGELADSLDTYNDFDDFNGVTLAKAAGATGFSFKTRFTVSYIDTNNANVIVHVRTFVKRMDMATWRSSPAPSANETVDTLYTSIVYSYFNFN